jgi:WD40 repeat protein
VCAVSISLPHGDIYVATIDRSDRHRARSVVRLFSINGVAVASSTLAGRATCMDLSAIDHASGNVVAVGMEDGAVHVLDAETLLERRVLRSERTASITAIAVTADASAIVVGDQEGLLMRWSVSRPSEVLQI